MKKHGILHAELSRVIAGLGHGDRLVIGDAGLPIPAGTPTIDLAVTLGIPRFWDVLDAVLSEMEIEDAIIASEASSQTSEAIKTRLPARSISHEDFKSETATAKAIIRTGETTPYANIILISGVVF